MASVYSKQKQRTEAAFYQVVEPSIGLCSFSYANLCFNYF